ncbi:hypothetical protein [Pyxidicoccus xibeiensis]|uniref:hypothetical protein n=1 Tax=Pyxidicoccus xibeiensis TaxID=2906759 RepID=UPI0020A83719|nr:hypothetical protein [Pyxidicoccus xibeiensis]MCP3136831.1 hypothetical protein [Pyxidicoccus xibeiensis]
MTPIGPKPFRPSPAIPSSPHRPQPGPVQPPPRQSRPALDCFEPAAHTAVTGGKPPLEPPKPPPEQGRAAATDKGVKGPVPTAPYATETQGKPGRPPVTTTPPTSGRR